MQAAPSLCGPGQVDESDRERSGGEDGVPGWKGRAALKERGDLEKQRHAAQSEDDSHPYKHGRQQGKASDATCPREGIEPEDAEDENQPKRDQRGSRRASAGELTEFRCAEVAVAGSTHKHDDEVKSGEGEAQCRSRQ